MIRDKIEIICKEKKISVRSVEKAAGISNGAINKWNDASPTVKKLQAVANVLNIKITDLLD
jgi:transcriptional regulator with XRE-family HTH domain